MIACSCVSNKNHLSVDPPQPTCSEGGVCSLPEPKALDAAANNPPPLLFNNLISDENWQFTLPGSNWSSIKSPANTGIKAFFSNEVNGCRVIFFKKADTASYAEYIISFIRGLSTSGQVMSAKQVIINDVKFILFQVKSKIDANVFAWMWVTQKDGFDYSLTCGGEINPDAGTSIQDVCMELSASLKIK